MLRANLFALFFMKMHLDNKYLHRRLTVYGEPVEPLTVNTSASSVRMKDTNKLSHGYLKGISDGSGKNLALAYTRLKNIGISHYGTT